MTSPQPHPLVKQHLADFGITAKVVACDPELADTAAFCAHYGYSPDESANTLIVASREAEPRFAACLVLASTKLDVNKKVRQLMGVKKLSFATAEQTKALTGMMIGGVVVVGLAADLPIYIDAAVLAKPEIIIGGGNRSSKLILHPAELLKLPHAHVEPNLAVPR